MASDPRVGALALRMPCLQHAVSASHPTGPSLDKALEKAADDVKALVPKYKDAVA